MLKRNDRTKLAESLRHYLSGQISNFEFMKRTDMLFGSEDSAVKHILDEFWPAYDDCHKHYNTGIYKLDEASENNVKRFILFLKSDVKYEWKEFKFAHNPIRLILHLITWGKYPKKWDDEIMNEGNRQVWPFFKITDLNDEINNPKYLS